MLRETSSPSRRTKIRQVPQVADTSCLGRLGSQTWDTRRAQMWAAIPLFTGPIRPRHVDQNLYHQDVYQNVHQKQVS